MKYNCAQRAHQNTLEILPSMIVCTLATGLKYPFIAAGLGGAFVLGKILYTIRYSSGDPNQRNKRGGVIGSLSFLGLGLTATYTVFQLVQSEL